MRCILLVLFLVLVLPIGTLCQAAAATCDAQFVVTEVSLPPDSDLTTRQQTIVRAHLTGRCFSGTKPNELSNWELAQLGNLGYYDAKVEEPTVTVLDASRHPQPVSLSLKFTKGARYRVREITWLGIQAISMERIASISELSPHDILDLSKVEETLDTVRLLYHAIGYPGVVITPQIQCDKNGHSAIVNYIVSEGAQYP